MRLSNFVHRGILPAAFALAISLSYFSVRGARANHFAGLQTVQGIEQAAHLRPGDAGNQYPLPHYCEKRTGLFLEGKEFFWRRRRDSNPRGPFEPNGFQDRRFQPLTHSSASDYILQSRFAGFSRKAGGSRNITTIICPVMSRSRDIMRYSKRFFKPFFRQFLA